IDQPPARSTPAPAPAFGGDDFLASLLAIETPALPPTPAADVSDEDLGLNIDMAPFSLEGLSDEQRGADSSADVPPAPATPGPQADEQDMTPFSLSDLGLSEDEIAAMDGLGAIDTPAAPEPQAEEPDMTPFSLSDLGLSEDEIAAMDSLGAIEAAPTPTSTPPPAAEDDDIKISP